MSVYLYSIERRIILRRLRIDDVITDDVIIGKSLFFTFQAFSVIYTPIFLFKVTL